MAKIICKTPHLLLRHLYKRDRDALIPVFQDPEVMRYSVSGIKSLSRIESFIVENQNSYEINRFGSWAVELLDSHQCIGICGINIQPLEEKTEFEVGYGLSRDYWGKGFATEAARGVQGFWLQRVSLKEIHFHN